MEVNAVTAGGGSQASLQGVNADVIAITGGLDVADGGTIEITGLGPVTNWNPGLNYSWVIASSTTGVTGFNVSNFNLDTSAFVNNNALNGAFSLSTSSNNLILNYAVSAVPEITSLFFFGGSITGFIYWRARGWRKIRLQGL